MKFSTNAKEVLSLVNLVIAILPKRTTVVGYNLLCLQAEGGRVSVKAYNGETMYLGHIPAVVEEEGASYMEAKSLRNILKSEKGLAHFSLEGDKLVYRRASISRTVNLFPESEFPVFPHIETLNTNNFVLDASTVMSKLKKVAHSMSNEETRYYLQSIFMEFTPAAMKMTATDGHRLAHSSLTFKEEDVISLAIPTPAPTEEAPTEKPKKGKKAKKAKPEDESHTAPADKFLFPSGNIRFLEKIQKVAKANTISFKFGYGWKNCSVNVGNHFFYTLGVDGSFPDYTQILPRNIDLRLKMETATLREALSNFHDGSMNAVRMTITSRQILFDNADKSCSYAHNLATTWDKEEPLIIGFNSLYILDAISTLKDECVLELTNHLSPLKITPAAPKADFVDSDIDTEIYVIMPCRI